jgi:hypothetical protein
VRFANNLPDAVAVARAMRRGGVGWYPHSGFTHLDTGPVRNWDLDELGLQDLLITGRSAPGGPGRQGRDVGQRSRDAARRPASRSIDPRSPCCLDVSDVYPTWIYGG